MILEAWNLNSRCRQAAGLVLLRPCSLVCRWKSSLPCDFTWPFLCVCRVLISQYEDISHDGRLDYSSFSLNHFFISSISKYRHILKRWKWALQHINSMGGAGYNSVYNTEKYIWGDGERGEVGPAGSPDPRRWWDSEERTGLSSGVRQPQPRLLCSKHCLQLTDTPSLRTSVDRGADWWPMTRWSSLMLRL